MVVVWNINGYGLKYKWIWFEIEMDMVWNRNGYGLK